MVVVVRPPALMLMLPVELHVAPAPLVLARVVVGGGAPRPADRSRRHRADSTENVVFGEFAGRPHCRAAPLLPEDTCRITVRDVNEPPLRPGDSGLPTDCMHCRTGLGGRRSGVEEVNGEEYLFFGDEGRITEPPMEVPQGVAMLPVFPPSTVDIITLVPDSRTCISWPLLTAAAVASQESS